MGASISKEFKVPTLDAVALQTVEIGQAVDCGERVSVTSKPDYVENRDAIGTAAETTVEPSRQGFVCCDSLVDHVSSETEL